jgi:carboxyl-terminal processing protease
MTAPRGEIKMEYTDLSPVKQELAVQDNHRAATDKPRLAVIIIATFVLGLVTGQFVGVGPQRSGASSSMTDHPQFESLKDAWDLVHNNYVMPEELDDAELLYGAASGMMAAVGDTGHSAFLDPVDAKAFRASLKGELIGVGLRISFDGEFPVVVAPIDGSPAEKAGIEADDTIMEIDGVSTDRMSNNEVSSALRGAEGDEVTLMIGRPLDGTTFTVTLTRARIKVDPVEWAWLPDDLFLVRLNEFSSDAGEEVGDALTVARDEGASGIVLDLRGNPGGLVTVANEVAGQFLPDGEVLYQHQKRDEESVPVLIDDSAGLGLDIPLVVLVDRGSASAAEIVASALRDSGRAEIVGSQTFGTGTVVSSYTLIDGSIAAIGTALWKTPEGELVRNIGVAPTIEISLDPGVEPIAFESEATLTSDDIDQAEDDQLVEAMRVLAPAESPMVGVS